MVQLWMSVLRAALCKVRFIIFSWERWAMRVISESGGRNLKVTLLFVEIKYWEMFYEDQIWDIRLKLILLETLMDFEWKESQSCIYIGWASAMLPVSGQSMRILDLVSAVLEAQWDNYNYFQKCWSLQNSGGDGLPRSGVRVGVGLPGAGQLPG